MTFYKRGGFERLRWLWKGTVARRLQRQRTGRHCAIGFIVSPDRKDCSTARNRGGKFSEDQLKVISDWLEKGPDLETDGLVRWRVEDAKNKIQASFGAKYSMEGTRRLMRRLGFRHVSPRPPQGEVQGPEEIP